MTEFDPTLFRLASHGDSQERGSAAFLTSKVPAYELFWAHHIVPLTCRIYDADLPFVRPFLPLMAKNLVNASYTTMHHLTWCDRYRKQIESLNSKERALQTEAFYCYLSHSTSFLEGLAILARAVDDVFNKLNVSATQRPPFGVKQVRSERSGRLHWAFFPDRHELRKLVDARKHARDEVSILRNRVVHDCPLFIVRGRIPAPNMLDDYSGLSAISEAVARRDLTLASWQKLTSRLRELMNEQSTLANGWWLVSHRLLSELPKDAYSAFQWSGANRGRGLTRRDFEKFLGDTDSCTS